VSSADPGYCTVRFWRSGASPNAPDENCRSGDRRCFVTPVLCAVMGTSWPFYLLADRMRNPPPVEALQALRKEGLRIVMLTGDARSAAQKVARQLEIDEFHAEVLPHPKSELVKKLRTEAA